MAQLQKEGRRPSGGCRPQTNIPADTEALPSALPTPWLGGLRAQPLGPQGLLRQNGVDTEDSAREASQASRRFPETSLWGWGESEGRTGRRAQPGSAISPDPPSRGRAEGLLFLSRLLLSVPIFLIHSFSHLLMYSAFIDLCWVLGIHGIKGFTTEGKRKT